VVGAIVAFGIIAVGGVGAIENSRTGLLLIAAGVMLCFGLWAITALALIYPHPEAASSVLAGVRRVSNLSGAKAAFTSLGRKRFPITISASPPKKRRTRRKGRGAAHPGSLSRVAKKIGDARVNIRYSYAGSGSGARRASVYSRAFRASVVGSKQSVLRP
jgi:hypothetical protein